MRNTLIFASIASIAAAITVYFMIEKNKEKDEAWYVSDADLEAYNSSENTGPAQPISKAYNAMS